MLFVPNTRPFLSLAGSNQLLLGHPFFFEEMEKSIFLPSVSFSPFLPYKYITALPPQPELPRG